MQSSSQLPNRFSTELLIEGQVQLLKDSDCPPDNLPLVAYAFTPQGRFLSSDNIETSGSFSMAVKLPEPIDIDLYVGPETDPQKIRQSSAYRQTFRAKEWIQDNTGYRLKPVLDIPPLVWRPWWPRYVCVSGHVRKLLGKIGNFPIGCSVPYVKVEVFDVDREACWFPYLDRLRDVLRDRLTIPVPELLERVPEPIDPIDPPPLAAFSRAIAEPLPTQVAQLPQLTLTSRLAPWYLFPRCFYSKQKLCETRTDENGFFQCCFRWFPFSIRRGRLRYDAKPDIIVRVTQIIDGIERVLYLDPYSNTRWNETNAHIDLYLEDDDLDCGEGGTPQRPPGNQVFFTRIGDDEVYDIDQTSGAYGKAPYQNVAYGGFLRIYAQFGDNLSDGSPKRYYRLSYAAKGSSNFKPIKPRVLSDTRVDKTTLVGETYTLGPTVVGSEAGLYEVRNFEDYYWYNPDLIGYWNTPDDIPDTGAIALRLEVFDDSGNKLTSATVDYRDGTTTPGSELATMTDACDLVLTVDNNPPELVLDTPAKNPCGVIPSSQIPTLAFGVKVSQKYNRLYSWSLTYSKGTTNSFQYVTDDNPATPGVNERSARRETTGISTPVDTSFAGTKLTTGLTHTCAFVVRLVAYPHIRDGRQFIYRREVEKAIAIDF
ncbi:hypothetical protein POG22_00890 [Geitlerinema sp. CS-897]|nr:hypothetical protein [Geitlerinema sp. CS-897]